MDKQSFTEHSSNKDIFDKIPFIQKNIDVPQIRSTHLPKDSMHNL